MTASLKLFRCCFNQFSAILNRRALSYSPFTEPKFSEKFPKKKIYERHDIWASDPDSKFTEVEKVEGHWHYVERLFPKKLVPEPPKHEGAQTPSGWTPTPAKRPDCPYFVARTRNHQIAVFMWVEEKTLRQITSVNHVQGDIWTLEKELRAELEKLCDKVVVSGVHEVAGKIKFVGDHVNFLKEWLIKRGF